MHKQHPQTAYRKYAGLIGTIFENCDRSSQPPCYLAGRLACCLRNDRLAQCAGSHSVLYKTTPAQLAPRGGVRGEDVSGIIRCRWCRGSAGERVCFSYRPAHCTMRWAALILPDKSGKSEVVLLPETCARGMNTSRPRGLYTAPATQP